MSVLTTPYKTWKKKQIAKSMEILNTFLKKKDKHRTSRKYGTLLKNQIYE